MGARGRTVLCIISVMATLAQRSEVRGVAIFGSVVEVCDGEHHFNRFGKLPVLGSSLHNVGVILHAAELASVIRPLQYGGSYLFPVLRIAFLVFGSYRHTNDIYFSHKNF